MRSCSWNYCAGKSPEGSALDRVLSFAIPAGLERAIPPSLNSHPLAASPIPAGILNLSINRRN
jgi:hypothetical protein